MKRSYVISEARQIKDYVEKYRKIPLTNTYADNTILSIYSSSYLMAALIKNWSAADVKLAEVIIYNQSKYNDSINGKVLKEDYIVMINNFISYCKEHRRVPTYITTTKSRIKVSFELFTYCLAKIINYYDKNKVLPNYCLFNKEDIQNNAKGNEKHKENNNKYIAKCQNKVNANKGCDAMGQNTPYYCGVCALQKCLYKFGINVSQKQLAKVCGTTTAGTSHQGLRTGIAWINKKYNVNIAVTEKSFSDYTLAEINKILCDKDKAIIWHLLYRLKYGHYEFVKSIDLKTGEFQVMNSLGDKCALGCYCGYIERRSLSAEKQYINGISQKSLIILTKK